MRLKYQLFLTLLLSSGVLIAVLAAFSSWSFDRGFLAYVDDTERQRLEPLIEALAEGHAREGDWRRVIGNREAWVALLDEHIGGRRRRPPSGPSAPRREPPPGPSSGSPPGDGRLLTIDPRLLLADAERRVLIGRAPREESDVRWQPIRVAERTVGYLGYRPLKALPGRLDQLFAARQKRSFLYAALAMVLLSALLAIALAARIVRPLLQVNDAVERIGRGQYAHRVPVGGADEIGKLARDINRLALTLEKNLTARRQWLAEISHELRTPVAVLRGELEAIQDGVKALDAAAVASLHAEALRLGRLIDDLHELTVSDVGALDYRFEPLDLREILSDRLAAARNVAEALSVEAVLGEKPAPIEGDRQRLGQLVDNLLQNSLRYTEAGGRVRIALSRGDHRIVVDWSDSAPGVDDEHLPRLFEPLYRVDASRRRDGRLGEGSGTADGSGLGLAIVRKIVEAHGGEVTAGHSALGGLSVRIELPERAGAN